MCVEIVGARSRISLFPSCHRDPRSYEIRSTALWRAPTERGYHRPVGSPGSRPKSTWRIVSICLSKASSTKGPIGRSCEEFGACGGHIFPWESPGLVTNKSRALWLQSQQPASSIFSRYDYGSGVVFFCGRAVATAVAVACAASCGTQRASSVNAIMSTCQSDGAALLPANLSCPGV